MTLSTHAAAAKAIRTELKKYGIKARVTCSTYSMGDSVDVHLENEPPWTMDAIKSFASRYQYGHFDGMIDCYEYSNRRDDIPQVMFVFVRNDFSDDMHQKAYTYLLNTVGAYSGFLPKYKDIQNLVGSSGRISEEVHQVLTGAWDARCTKGCTLFWHKPRVKIAA